MPAKVISTAATPTATTKRRRDAVNGFRVALVFSLLCHLASRFSDEDRFFIPPIFVVSCFATFGFVYTQTPVGKWNLFLGTTIMAWSLPLDVSYYLLALAMWGMALHIGFYYQRLLFQREKALSLEKNDESDLILKELNILDPKDIPTDDAALQQLRNREARINEEKIREREQVIQEAGVERKEISMIV